jgi:hypothetical protein
MPSNIQATIVSSLKGHFLPLVIQVTRDLEPVVYSQWFLPDTVIDLGVSDVDLRQFEALATKLGRDGSLIPKATPDELPRIVSESMISLTKLLTVSPCHSLLTLSATNHSTASAFKYSYRLGASLSFSHLPEGKIHRPAKRLE